MEKMFSRITSPKSCGEKFWRGLPGSTRGKKYLGAGYSKIWKLSRDKENIWTWVIINIKNSCIVFGILLGLFYIILPFNFTCVQLADVSSAGQSDKQQQNKSLFSSKLLQFPGSSTHAENRKPNILNCTNNQKKVQLFQNLQFLTLKTLKTIQLWYFRFHEAIDF